MANKHKIEKPKNRETEKSRNSEIEESKIVKSRNVESRNRGIEKSKNQEVDLMHRDGLRSISKHRKKEKKTV